MRNLLRLFILTLTLVTSTQLAFSQGSDSDLHLPPTGGGADSYITMKNINIDNLFTMSYESADLVNSMEVKNLAFTATTNEPEVHIMDSEYSTVKASNGYKTTFTITCDLASYPDSDPTETAGFIVRTYKYTVVVYSRSLMKNISKVLIKTRYL